MDIGLFCNEGKRR